MLYDVDYGNPNAKPHLFVHCYPCILDFSDQVPEPKLSLLLCPSGGGKFPAFLEGYYLPGPGLSVPFVARSYGIVVQSFMDFDCYL